MILRSVASAFAAALALSLPAAPARAGDPPSAPPALSASGPSATRVVHGRLVRFECGDNCWLVLALPGGGHLAGLCNAPACADWLAAGALPPAAVGRAVRVRVRAGHASAGDGAAPVAAPDFRAIAFEREAPASAAPPASATPARPANGVRAASYRASGNEPFWSLLVDERARRLTLERPAHRTASWPITRDATDATGRTLRAGPLAVRIEPVPCRDDMSGLPRPDTVRFTLDGRAVAGCGGDAHRLLDGPAWRVLSVDGTPMASATAPVLRFTAQRLQVAGACGEAATPWRITGDGLAIAALPAIATDCAPDAARREARLRELLRDATHFDVDVPGQLRLQGPAGVVVAARTGSADTRPGDAPLPVELLADPAFRAAWQRALGARAPEAWITRLDGPAVPVREVDVDGRRWRLIAACERHDCADRNLVALHDPASMRIHALVMRAGRPLRLGEPVPPAVADALERLWRDEWRSGAGR